MDVIVCKSLDLRPGETLGHFTGELSAAARTHVMTKQNMTPKTGSAYVIEVFSKTVVVNTYKFNDNGRSDKFLAIPFKRDTAGAFTFGDATEVERVTSFQEKTTLSTTKRIHRQADVVETSADGAKYVRAV
jgi:hypothetical protein